MRSTHTLAILELSREAWEEIAQKLRGAGYDHAFLPEDVIDMQGIGIAPAKPEVPLIGAGAWED